MYSSKEAVCGLVRDNRLDIHRLGLDSKNEAPLELFGGCTGVQGVLEARGREQSKYWESFVVVIMSVMFFFRDVRKASWRW